MILWLTGNSGSGKTTLAQHLKTRDAIILDGDDMRNTVSDDIGFSKEDRWNHNIRIAKLAKVLEKQGFTIIISLICPFEDLRKEVQTITDCVFIYLNGGLTGEDYPYEVPKNYNVALEKWGFAENGDI